MRSLIAVVCLLACSSCLGPKRSISVDAIAPSCQAVFDRHDQYIKQDASMAPQEKEIYLHETQGLRQVFEEAMK